MTSQLRAPDEDALQSMQWATDPHADNAVAAILAPGLDPAERERRVNALNRAIRRWKDNKTVRNWTPTPEEEAAGLAEPLAAYLSVAREPLPESLRDDAALKRGEDLFMGYGALSVAVLFCASLPECYVVPDLAEVLQATGRLEKRTELRIRRTGAMIFPVMMRGGLTTDEGSGISQVLKVRLIHATIRHLILRGHPTEALTRMHAVAIAQAPGLIPPLPESEAEWKNPMYAALYGHGWNLREWGMPNNQEELAYTLLTFNYVFLRSLRRLGIPFGEQAERDYLFIWNVAGHYLGIEQRGMVKTMAEAEALFARIQERGREEWARRARAEDPRPPLGAALMNAMRSAIPLWIAKGFPVLMTRYLMEPASVKDLKLDQHVSIFSRGAFWVVMGGARGIDAVVRLVFPSFSIARFLTRIMGYRLTVELLMGQTEEPVVPGELQPGDPTQAPAAPRPVRPALDADALELIAQWGHDPQAGKVMNAMEDMLTTRGEWTSPAR